MIDVEYDKSARKPPLSLFKIANATLLDEWLSGLQLSTDKDKAVSSVRTELSRLPSWLANEMTSVLVASHVQRLKGCNHSELSLLLVDVLGAAATTVDLSPLTRLKEVVPAVRLAFGDRLVSALPRLGQLTRLTLQTQGKSFTLPVCSDGVLEALGRHCPNLTFLDVSHNTGVSATGLDALATGCPGIEELHVYDCVLPTAVLAGLLQRLPQLRVLGHHEVGAAVQVLSYREDDGFPPLRLTQVSNLGESAIHRQRHGQDPNRLRCRASVTRALRALCPALEELRVRVLDEDVPALAALRALRTLELRFHAKYQVTSLGKQTIKYLLLHGGALTSLTVYSGTLETSHFAVVGQHCPNLVRLWMRSNYLHVDDPYSPPEPSCSSPFSRLEDLSIRVGVDDGHRTHFPASFVKGLVRHTRSLRELYLAVNSRDVTDQWLEAVLGSFDCSALRTLYILMPDKNRVMADWEPRLALTPASVHLVRTMVPDLEVLGNLLVWNLQQEEVRHMQQQLRRTNCVLKLIFKTMTWR